MHSGRDVESSVNSANSHSQSAGGAALFRVGTLVYTRSALVVLFGWLLWGDFVFTLMEAVMPALLPLLLKANGAGNQEIVFIASTIHMAMNALLNPIVSYQSDRLRTPWGRRRPFIALATPFIVVFLAATPFVPDLASFLQSHQLTAGPLASSPFSPMILLFGLLVGGFQLFNMFVASVYYYLIPDVVPHQFIGRFYALFRVFGALASFIFNYFIFGLAASHMKIIFVSISLLYGVFILLMCFRVKEGEYPPVVDEARGHWWSGIQNYFKECFGHRYYWWVFLAYSLPGWAAAGNIFAIFFFRDELGISEDLYGKTTAWCLLAFIVLAYPFGVLMDRWGCHKTLFLGLAALAVTSLLSFLLATDKPSGLFWLALRSLPVSLISLALAKWTIEVYPSDRYGQFGSAGALFSSIGGIILGQTCAYWITQMHHYRYFLLWSFLFTLIGLYAVFNVYRQWKILGGTAQYCPP